MRLLALAAAAVAVAGAASSAGGAIAGKRALLIGIDKHADQRLDAKLGNPAANDVAAIKGLLTSKLGFADDDIRVLIDQAATAAAIREGLADWLIAGSKQGEKAYLYFAGNGYFTADASGDEADGLDEGLVPFDATVSEEGGKLAISGLVLDDEIGDALTALKGRQVTVIADAGFSGRVTREPTNEAQNALYRAPAPASATRAIVVEAKAAAQKSEGGYLDTVPDDVEVVAWTAVSASQTAMLDPLRSGSGGIFTSLYLEALRDGKADANGNGQISNPEVLAYIGDGAKAYCSSRTDVCQMGLTPRLEPPAAHGLVAFAAVAAKGDEHKLSLDTLKDFLSKGNEAGVGLSLTPEGELHVGDKDIRFHVRSPHDGFLVLLDLADDGQLTQLFPNQFSRKKNTDGKVGANAVLMVPDDYYGMRFNATTPNAGQIIAIVARRKVDWEKAVGTRAIEVIPRQEAVKSFLPQIAAALGNPVANSNPADNTEPMEWSVATMRYEIKPR
jgi:hypothetical protein